MVERVTRAGKYLVWALSGERYLLMHLRMTGTLLFDPAAPPPHTRVVFELDDGHRLVYVDPRRFGTGHLVFGDAARDEYLNARIGVEPLTPEFTAEHLRSMARERTAPVKAFVLDQRRIAGVGNIYADEALFRAGIHPLRPAGRLTAADWARAAGRDRGGARAPGSRRRAPRSTTSATSTAPAARSRTGSSSTGAPASRVPTCGRPIRKIVVGGRGTYVCEHCQPRPATARRVRGAAAARLQGRALGGRARSAARSSVKPPSAYSPIMICGKVYIPVFS